MRLDVMPLVAAGTMASTPQPEIASADAGLLLRTWRLDDAPAFLAAFTDPAIQLWHRRDIVDLDEAETWIATSGAEWGRETKANWAVVRPADDIVLGRVSVSDLQLADGVAQVSYWVATEARRQRVAPRAVDALSRWAFGDLGLSRLELRHSTVNHASCRVAERSWFAAEGTAVRALLHADWNQPTSTAGAPILGADDQQGSLQRTLSSGLPAVASSTVDDVLLGDLGS